MSNLLGVIKAVIGLVYVVEADGSQRLLKEGDRIYSGEEIVTGDSGAVSMELPNGKTLDLGRNSHWSEHGLNAVSTSDHDTQDVASLQKAIADGADPTQALEATAAGNEAPVQIEGGGGGHTLVQLDLTGKIVDPIAGFNTAGIGAPTPELNLPENGFTTAGSSGSPAVLPPLVHIDDFAGNDGFINKNEINHTNINGTSNQNHITLTFTDSQKNTITIDVPVNNGHWTANPDLSGLVEGEITVLATATDVSGRTAQSTADSLIDVTDLHDQITIDSVTADNVINIAESREAQTSVHGTVGGDAKIGDAITLTVDGKEYHDVVIDLGNGNLGYRINVSTQGLLANPNIHATVTSTDEAGNTTQASSDHHVDIDLNVHNSVTIETIAGDDVVNMNESRMPTMVAGVVGGDAKEGDPVTVTVGGRDFHGVVVNDNGHLRYEIPVPSNLLKEGANDVQVQVTSHDTAGNEAIAIEHHTLTLDTQAHNALTIETVAGDDTVNRSESRMPTFISGEVTGDAQVGDHVVVSVNGQNFNGEVVADENGKLRYTVPVPTSALNEGSNDVQVMVTGVDNVGNAAIAVENKTVVLDTQAHNALTIETVAGDDIVNRTESRMPTFISGEVSGDAHAGDHVVVSVNGQNFYGTVTDENGQLRYEVPVPTAALTEGSNDVQVMITGTDNAGNATTAVEHKNVVLDTHAENHVIIQTVAGDNVVNATESRMPTMISGVVSGDAQVGDKVVVSVNGHEYPGDVVTDENGQLRYEVPVPTAALNEGSNDVQVMVTGVDASGNTAIAVEHKNVVLDTHAENHVIIQTVAGDNVVNAAESRMPTMISGVVSGDAQAGDKVVVSVNGHEYRGEVVADANSQLRYEVPVPTHALNEGSNDVQVMVTGVDASGNTAIAVEHQNVVLDTHAENHVIIQTVAGDNVVNAVESRMPMMISGVVSGDAQAGDKVVVSVNGHEYRGDVVTDENGQLRYEVPVPTAALNEGNNDVQVMVTGVDASGNTAIVVEHQNVVLDTLAHNALTIETVAGDNTVNATESRMPTLISGEVSGDAQVGDHVVVSVNGQNFYGMVTDENGQLRYTVPVPTAALSEGNNDVQVMITGVDASGNATTAIEHTTLVLDTQASNALTIDTVAGDDTVNAAEGRMPTLISGVVSGDAQVGDHVVVSVNGHEYRGDVVADENGQLRYEVPVPTAALNEGNNDVQVMVTSVDASGNTAIAAEHKNVVLDTHAENHVIIQTVAGDNVVNAAESRMPTMISGVVSGDAQVGDKVVVSVNGHEYRGDVMADANGQLRYEVPVPTAALNEGNNDVQVMITGVDASGNTAIVVEHQNVVLDTQAHNALTIETVAGDNTVNASESRMPTLISGEVSGDAQVGDHVVVSVNGHDFNGQVVVDANGQLRYEVPVPTAALNEGNNDVQVMVTGVDASGNTAIAVEHKTVVLDTQAHNALTIETVAGDNTVNASESRMPTLISGEVSGDAHAGDHVVVSVNGQNFYGTVTDENGQLRYEVPVPTATLNEGSNDVQVMITGTDNAGNATTAIEHTTVVLDTQASNALTIETVAGDDTVNASESRMPTLISGVVSGDAQAGDKVVVSVNGHEYHGDVVADANGQLRYEVPVPKAALNEGNNDVQVMVTGVDASGNTAIAVEHKTVVLDTQAHNAVTIDTVAGDNSVNASESRMPTMISGVVSGDAQAGDHVVVSVNGHEYHGDVVADANGQLRYEVPVPTHALNEGNNDVQVMVTGVDASGNTAIAVEHQNVVLDTHAENHVIIQTVAGDNVVNAAESRMPTLISGVVSGDAQAGDKVVVSVNGHEYHGDVVADANGQLRYEVPVPTTALSEGNNDVQVMVTGVDASGNTAITVEHQNVVLDTQAHNALTIETVAGDDTVNASESRMPTLISGEVSGDAHAGDKVVVSVNGHEYRGDVVADANGQLRYEVPVPTAALNEGNNDVQVMVTGVDASGNTAIAVEHKTVVLDTQAHNALTIETVAGDNTVNASESRMPTLISGEVSGDAHAGDHVVVSVNGQNFYGTVTDENGQLRYEVPVPTATLNEGSNDVQVMITGTDNAGNATTAIEHTTVVLDTQASNALTIETVAGDDTVNTSESRMPTLISGEVSGDAQVGDHVVVSVNGHDFNGQVVVDANGQLRYEVPVPTAALNEGNNDVQVMVTGVDASGNTAIAVEHKTVVLDTQAHNAVTIDTVAGDNTVNASESRMPTMISGVVSGDAQAGDHVVVSVNGHEYRGDVVADANGQLRYEVPVPTAVLNEGNNDVQVMVTGVDASGNTAIAVEHQNVVLDTQAHNVVAIDTVAGDNTVNASESRMPTFISGNVTGDAQAGDRVVVSVNGHDYNGVVMDNNGHLTYEVPLPDGVLHEGSNDVQVMVTGTDNAGNTAISTAHQMVIVDTQAQNSITIDTVATDNVVNAAESRMPTLISGEVSGDAQVGDHVVVSVNGHDFNGQVVVDANGQLRYEVPVPTAALNEGNNDVQVMVTGVDASGNTAIAAEHKTVVLDTQAHNVVTIDTVAGDNTVNASESRMPTLISGEVSGDAQAGDKVVVSVNGHEYHGDVVADANGQLRYEVPVPTAVLNEGSNNVQVMVTGVDASGNTAIAVEHKTVVLDTQAHNAVTIDTVAGDNIVNAHEGRMPTFISGNVSGDAQAGDHVVVSVNGHDYNGVVVDNNGHLTYTVPLPDGVLHEGSNDVKVMVTGVDASGNTAIAVDHKTVTVDTQANNTVTINDATKDNILNHTELGHHNQTITGVVGGDAQIGDEVTLEINGHYYRGRVEDMHDGKGTLGYKIPVLSSEFGNNNTILMKDVPVTVTLVSHDAAGNEAIAVSDHTIHVDNHAYNGVTINTVAGDNVVNAGESKHETLVTGRITGKDAHIGDTVDVTVGKTTVPGTIFADPQGHLYYEAKIPTGVLIEGKNDVTVKVTSHDAAHNEAVATEHTTITLDTHADATINIHELTAGPVLNYDELDTPKQLITGAVGDDARVGDKVSIEINGHFYGGKVIDLGSGHLGYQIPVDSSAFGDNQQQLGGKVTIIASVTSHDAAGNEVTVHTDHTVQLDNHAEAGITINPLTGDGIINNVESQQVNTKLTGTVNGDVHKGDEVLVMVNGHPYEATVQELPHQNGALGYSVDVLTTDLLADPNPDAYIVGYDANGNIQLAQATQNVGIDLQAEATITIDPVTGDNMINGDESHNEFTTITGKVGGDVKVGDLVHLEVNGIDMTTQVFKDPVTHQLGYKIDVSTYDLMADPKITATVTATDNANNVITVHADQDIIVDTRVDATISVDSVTQDNVLNGAELKQGYTLVSGKVTGEMHPGDPLTLTVNGQVYHGFVENQGVDAKGHMIMGYHIPVSTADIQANPNIHASIDVTDAAKNHAVATANHHVGIDDHATASVTINIVSGDDVLNANDQQAPTTIINGKVGGDVKAGDTVHVIVNGVDHPVTVADQGHGLGLGYSIAVNTLDLLADPKIVATVDATDKAGNTASASTSHDVGRADGAHATITIDPVTDDNTINNAEAHNPLTTVTGHVNGDVNPGDLVDLDVNGQHYYGTVDKNLAYKIDVSTDDLLSVKSPLLHASVTGHDAAGNTVLATTDHAVGVATIEVHNLQINGSHDFWLIEGYVGGDAKEGDKIVIHVGADTYNTSVIKLPDGHLGFNGDDLHDPVTDKHVYIGPHTISNNTDITVEITTTDPYGNPETATAHLLGNVSVPPLDGNGTVTPPQHTPPDVHITVSPVAGNNVINQQESQSGHTTIRGTVSGDVHVGDDVIIYIGTRPYHGQVFEHPNLPGEYSYKIDVDTDELNAHPGFSVTMFGGSSHVEGMVTFDTDVHATITLDDVAGDNTINIAESHKPTTTVSGTVTGDVNDGDNVTLLINGNSLTAQVHQDPVTGELRFTKEVSTDDLRQDPTIKVSVTGHDDQGNTIIASDDKTIAVDTSISASVTIDPIGHHNVLNLNDTQQLHTTITGKVGGDVNPGDEVTVNVNGHIYDHIKIDGNHSYSVDVLTSDMANGGKITAQVTGHDAAGNTTPGSANLDVTVDTTAAGNITMNTVSGDNVLSYHDLQSPTTRISGTVGGDAKVGDDVTIMVNNHITPVKVIELPHMNGQLGYVADVNTHDLSVNPDIHVTVTGSDSVGNSFTAESSKTIVIDDHADVTMNVNDVAGDNVLNLAESKLGKTTITGTVHGDVHEGDKVTIHVNGNDLPGTLHHQTDGSFTFSLDVNTSDLLADQTITYKVTGVDQYGNTLTITETNTITIDQIAENQIHIGTVAGDDIVNIVEHQGPTTTISGVVDGDAHDGDVVTLEINGKTYHGSVSDHDGKLTYDIPVNNSDLKEGNNTVTVSVTGQDAAGNPATSTDTHTITLDTTIDAHITLDPVAASDVINAAAADHVIITGTITTDSDARPGDKVTVEINHKTFTGDVKVYSDGHVGYDISVDRKYLQEGDNDIKVSVDAKDAAGNTITVDAGHHVLMDTQVRAAIHLDNVAGNNVINAKEVDHVSVTGTIDRDTDAQLGDHVTVTVNGQSFPGEVKAINGHLGYDIHVDKGYLHEGKNTFDVSVSATDKAGNAITVHDSHDVHVDTQLGATITLEPVAANDVINAAAADHVSVTGTVGTDSDAKLGDEVTVTVNGKSFTGVVQDINGHPGYDIPVDKGYLHEGTNTFDVSIKATDGVGNAITVHAGHDVHVDTQLDATITLDPVAANNVVNAAAIDHVSVTGMVGTDADAHVGDKVTVTVNGTEFKGDVVDVDGKGQLGYDIHVDRALLHENDNTIKVSVDAKDAAGNTVTVHEEHHVLVDTQLRAEITLDTVAGNNVINAKEVDHVSVTGTVGRDTDAQLGDHVTVTINHQSFTGVVSVINGHLGYDIPVDKGYLQDGKNTFDVSVSATDKAGNAITVHDSHDVLVDTHADAKITINNVTDDNRIDSQEARHHVTHITGQIDSADVHNNEHISVTVNDKHYDDVVLHEDNGHLTYDVPVNTNELHIGKNSVGVSVIANDDHGNTNVIHQKADFTMDDPSHRGKHDIDGSDKSHHAANAHSHDNGLSNLFDDSHDTFSFNLAHNSKGHHGDESLKIFTGKENHGNEKVDLSDLAHELHEGTDITQMIKGGDAHHGKGGASAADAPSVTPAHGGDAHHVSFDSAGAATHSLDHLIPKPEHYHS